MPFTRRLFYSACHLMLLVAADRTVAQEQQQSSQASSQQIQTEPASTEMSAVPNRPTIASTAEVVQSGVLELEYGFEGGDGHQNINGLVKLGLAKWLEVRVANNPIQRDAGVFGTGDSGAGFKLRMISQNKKWRPTVSLLYAAILPSASHGLGLQTYGHEVQILVSKDLGKHHFDWNEGIQLFGRPYPQPSGYDRGYFSALAWSHPLRGKWGFTAELAGTSKTNDAIPETMTILFAPTYSATPRLVLDAGAYFAAYGNLPRVTAFVGVTYSIVDLYHRGKRKSAHGSF